jgi:hypothetical protein
VGHDPIDTPPLLGNLLRGSGGCGPAAGSSYSTVNGSFCPAA